MAVAITSIIKQIRNALTTYQTFIDGKHIESLTKNIIKQSIDSPTGTIRKEVMAKSFRNLPPKIGYFDETTVPLIASFNMSINTGGAWAISDIQGKEIIYFPAKGSITATPKIFSGYRMDTSKNFIYENEPVIPAYLEGKGYLADIYGLGSSYMIARAVVNGESKTHLIMTNRDGFVKKWTEYKDISSIMSNFTFGPLCNIIYFPQYETLYMIGTRDGDGGVSGCLIDVNTGKLIKEEYICTPYKIVKSQNSNIVNLDTDLGSAGCVYNPEKSELVLMSRSYIAIEDSSGARSASYYYITIACNCDITHFKDGAGTLTNRIPDSEYVLSGRMGIMMGGDSGIRTSTYDDLDKTIRFIWRYQDSDEFTMFTQKAANASVESKHYFCNGNQHSVSSSVQSTDASPWAKRISTPFVFNEELYILGSSKKFGRRWVRITQKRKDDGTYPIEAGTWWIVDQATNDIIRSCPRMTCVKEGNSSTFYYCSPDIGVNEIELPSFVENGIQKAGKVSLKKLDVPAPPNPQNNGYEVENWIYNKILNKWFYVVSKGNENNIPMSSFVLEYDVATQAWKEHKQIPQSWLDCLRASYNDFKNRGYTGVSSNAFVDDNGTMYWKISFATIGGSIGGMFIKAKMENGNLIMTTSNGQITAGSYPSEVAGIGWNQKYHYYVTWGADGGGLKAKIFMTKDPAGASPDKGDAKAIYEDSNFYTVQMVCASATGMVCYLQDTPLFLGGYFTLVPAQEVPLKENCDNYIYFSRNREDCEKVDVEITQSPMPDSAVDNFYRIFVTKVTTNSEGPVSQEYNKIDYYGRKS